MLLNSCRWLRSDPERSQSWSLQRCAAPMWRTEESIQPLRLTVAVATAQQCEKGKGSVGHFGTVKLLPLGWERGNQVKGISNKIWCMRRLHIKSLVKLVLYYCCLVLLVYCITGVGVVMGPNLWPAIFSDPPPPSFPPPTSAAEAAPIVMLADVPGLFIETYVIVEDLVQSTKSLDEPPCSL